MDAGQEATVGTGHGRPVSHATFRLARLHRMFAGQLSRRIGLHPGQELVVRDGPIRRNHKDAPEVAEGARWPPVKCNPTTSTSSRPVVRRRGVRRFDRTTNFAIGTQRIRPQIGKLPDGNPIDTDVGWWPDD
ncbi:hypothetical protein SAMN05428945_2949 [Streptomyces sp. 2224.1]|uniref:hypothetical protein n=1 Tax=unclassified Streptomyces TaxID=2593676 RepID=UPI00087F78D9|nr:hypothetical protein BX261_2364 [Streptomyces sp. 2321.6]SDR49510.1 hypothetical protein SAMN05216511_4842 [Streptomyces sp. KS_16]SEC45499.1 hypothetical protein SAMN05428945_2949 [Streptomyces sp. 2224.1]SEC58990.1 hypothetical protein SAMN05428940_2366 [Streptomyces sp. 2133.1]SEE97035.1 hypothetical protein SAMN05428954_4877 [Streptomyces sp. 2112.3]SNC68458.1 hypothetical protein SAMN06272741_2361 [Streptomyces sp. 2114.4]